MRVEHIILLIIAFNVVSALVQRRAKKKRERAAHEAGARSGERTAPAAGEGEYFEEEEWETETRSRREESRPAEMPGLGRDILDQLARDLGLKSPKPAPAEHPERPVRPASPSSPPPQRSASRRVSERVEKRTIPVAASRPAPDRTAFEKPYVDKPYVMPEHPHRFDAASAAKRVLAADSTPGRKAPGSTPIPRVNLRDPLKLREAFILKEILDAPLSRRR